MDKECIIKNIVGDVLVLEGFIYFDKKEDGVEFIRKIENSKQEIVGQMISFHKSESNSMIYMDVRTSAAGHRNYRMRDFVPGSTDYVLHYSNDEEYVQAIKDYADILQKYGISFLKEIAEPILSDYFLDKDRERLYQDHVSLLNNYIQREGLEVKQFDIEQAAEWVEQKMLEMKGISFLKAKESILELCAFFEAVAMQYHSCKWILKDTGMHKSCLLNFPEAKPDHKDIAVLAFLWKGWIGNVCIKKILMERYKNVMVPYTYEELREFLEKEKAKENRGKIE